jgi:hypothetical protein
VKEAIRSIVHRMPSVTERPHGGAGENSKESLRSTSPNSYSVQPKLARPPTILRAAPRPSANWASSRPTISWKSSSSKRFSRASSTSPASFRSRDSSDQCGRSCRSECRTACCGWNSLDFPDEVHDRVRARATRGQSSSTGMRQNVSRRSWELPRCAFLQCPDTRLALGDEPSPHQAYREGGGDQEHPGQIRAVAEGSSGDLPRSEISKQRCRVV